MPLRQEFCPQVTVTWESPEVLRLELASAVTPLRPGRLNLAVIAAHEQLTQFHSVALHASHRVALISASGQLHRNLTGQTENHASRPANLVRAVSLAGLLLADAARRGPARIVLVWDHLPPSRLELELLASSLATQDIALDVITTAAAEGAWATLTSRAFGRVLVQQDQPAATFNDHLAHWNRVVLEGAEIRVRGLVGIGPQWYAGRTTLPPLQAGELHSVRLRHSSRPPESPSTEVRFLGLRYSVIVPLPERTAAQVA
jgi:hypothetical protein